VVPISWKLSSVKRQPVWQVKQSALLLNRTKPRLAASGIAVSSPPTQRSKGAGPGSNLGSRAMQLEDCVPSVNPKLAGHIECYWTTRPFDGWQGKEPATDAYAPKLAAHGF